MAVPSHLSTREQPLRQYLQRLIWLCLLPLAVVIVLLASEAMRRAHLHRTQEVQAVAERLVTSVDADLTRRIQGLLALNRMPLNAPPEGVPRELYGYARAYHDSFGTAVALGNSDRRILFSTRVPFGTPMPPMPPRPAALAAVDLAISTQQVVVGNPMFGPLVQKLIVPIVVPANLPEGRIGDSAGALRGVRWVWVANVDLAQYQRLLQDLAAPPRWSVAILDSTGQPVSQHADDRASPRGADTRWRLDLPLSERHVVMPVRNAPWSVVVQVPFWQFYAPQMEIAAVTLISLALTLGITGIVTRRAGRRLGDEVARLTDAPEADHDNTPQKIHIQEIEAARGELRRLAHERDRAERDRRDAQIQHLGAMRTGLRSLKRSEARLRAIFDGSSEGLAMVGEDLRLMAANPAIADMIGGSVHQLIGAPMQDMVPAELQAEYESTFRELRRLTELHGRATRRGMMTLQRRDGSRFLAESCTTCIRLGQELLYVVLLHDVTEREQQAQQLMQAHLQLAMAHAELHRLNAAQRLVEERERQRIARDLHDDLQQRMGLIQMKLELILAQARTAQPSTAALATEGRDATRQAIDAIRRIVNDLRPRTLDELGLVAALQQLADQTADMSGLQIEFEVIGSEAALDAWPEAVANCVYRLVQECLNNARKHAKASFVHVLIDVTRPDRLALQVSDDGRGIAQDDLNKKQSFGLRGMAERLALLHGRVWVTLGHGNDRQRGTTVNVEIPRPSATEASELDLHLDPAA